MKQSRRQPWQAAALGLGLVAMPGVASAATYEVIAPNPGIPETMADTHDADPTDLFCADENGYCTLRAAVEQANGHPGRDTILLLPGTYTIQLSEGSSTQTGDNTNALSVFDDVDIIGSGADSTIIDGNGNKPGFIVRTAESLVLDTGNGQILRGDYHGDLSTFVAPGAAPDLDQTIDALGLASYTGDPDAIDDVLVSTISSGILRFDGQTGAFENGGVFIEPDSVVGEFFTAGDMMLGPDGQLLVANSLPGGSILQFDVDTGLPVGDGVFIEGSGIANPTAMGYVFVNGQATVLVAYGNEGTVEKYDVDGNYLGNAVSFIPSMRDAFFTATRILVASESTNSILAYDISTGASLGTLVYLSSHGITAPFKLSHHRRFGITDSGDLYVTSYDDNRTLVFDMTTGEILREYVAGGGTVGQVKQVIWRPSEGGTGADMSLTGVTVQNTRGKDLAYSAALNTDRGASASVFECTFTENEGATYGGAVRNYGTLSIFGSSVTDNKLPPGGFGDTSNGAGIYNRGTLHIEDSLVARNLDSKGAGLAQTLPLNGLSLPPPYAEVLNTTFSRNSAAFRGGGVEVTHGSMQIVNATFAYNETGNAAEYDQGAGLFVRSGATVYLANSLFFQNTDRNNNPLTADCHAEAAGSLVSYRNNVFHRIDTTYCNIQDSVTGDLTGITYGTIGDPRDDIYMQEFVTYNGGPTLSHALLEGVNPNVAIDGHVTDAGSWACPATDQRGDFPRPIDEDGVGGAACDIGAIEVQTLAPDGDHDGIDYDVDGSPIEYSDTFGDVALGGNTPGIILERGGQAVTISDSSNPAEGVFVSADPAGDPTQPAEVLACGGGIVYLELFPGDSELISCLTADASEDRGVECTSPDGAEGVEIVGTASSVFTSPEDIEYLWSTTNPMATLDPVDEATTFADLPFGNTELSLTATDDFYSVTDVVYLDVFDNTPPTVTPPPDVLVGACGFPVDLGEATAEDVCSVGPLETAIMGEVPDFTTAGVFPVVWVATDDHGRLGGDTQNVVVGIGNSTSCCPAGSNIITGTWGNDTITGTSGPDCIFGYGGNDTIYGLGGDDIINGGPGIDTIYGGDDNDLIQGNTEGDFLYGEGGNDAILCGPGNDECFGGSGNDIIHGHTGNDLLEGGDDNDVLMGDDGNDTLRGGMNDDEHIGGSGVNQCEDTEGENTFVECAGMGGGGDVVSVVFDLQAPPTAWGYCVDIAVTNPNATTVDLNSVTFQISGGFVHNTWNGAFSGGTGTITVVPNQGWNEYIDPFSTKEVAGFCIQNNPFATQPTLVDVDASL